LEQQKKQIIEMAGKNTNPQAGMNQPSAEIMKKLEEIDLKVNTLSEKSITPEIHPAIKNIKEFLALNEFSPNISKRIGERLEKELSLEELNNDEIAQEKVLDWIGELIKIENLPAAAKKPRVIVLVGPTGEGKTTTIAKLAADYVKKSTSEHEQNICLVTIDQFRVAAGKQIETYATALNVKPTARVKSAAATSADDIRQIAAADKDLDILLIDTAGYSPNDFGNIGQMREILNIPELHPEIYLVVSATKTTSALLNIFTNYELFNCKAVIVTKMDETDRIGTVVSVLAEKGKSVAYVATGQKVYSDIKPAEPLDFLLKLTDIKIGSEHNG
jgi:flagellar biosynthesis protein FlhF